LNDHLVIGVAARVKKQGCGQEKAREALECETDIEAALVARQSGTPSGIWTIRGIQHLSLFHRRAGWGRNINTACVTGREAPATGHIRSSQPRRSILVA